MVNSSRGRPAQVGAARAALLAAARRHLELGDLHRVSSRILAEEAQVSHSLVNYHFGGRDGLVAASLAVGIAPHEVVAASVDDDGRVSLRRLYLGLVVAWQREPSRSALAHLARSAVAGGPASAAIVDYLQRGVVDALEPHLGVERTRRVATAIVGVVVGRFVLGIPTLAAMEPHDVVRMLEAMTRPA